MLLACPTCATAFRVPAEAFASAGRAVRCSRCAAVWTATAVDLIPEADEQPAEAVPAPAKTVAAPVRTEMARIPATTAATDDDDMADWAAAGLDVPKKATPAPEPTAPPPSDETAPPKAIVDAPPLVPDVPAADADGPVIDAKPASAIETQSKVEEIARRRVRLQPPAEKASPTTIALRIACGLFALVLCAAIYARVDVVRARPGYAGLYRALGMPVNLRGLELHEVKAGRETREGLPSVAIEGYVFNPGPKAQEVPKLRFAVMAAAGRELYAWTAAPSKPMLAAGEGIAFRSRLASPPQEGREIIVRFLNRRDLTSQAK